jgi:hypothetical protein
MPTTVWNSTAVQATAAAPECHQPRHKIVATLHQNSKHLGARLCMAAGRPMAWQSGYSEYAQGVQWLVRYLWVKAVSIMHTLAEVTSPQTSSDARMFPENTKKPYFGSTEHSWQGNVTAWRRNLFSGSKTDCTLRDLMFWWHRVRIGTAGLWCRDDM